MDNSEQYENSFTRFSPIVGSRQCDSNDSEAHPKNPHWSVVATDTQWTMVHVCGRSRQLLSRFKIWKAACYTHNLRNSIPTMDPPISHREDGSGNVHSRISNDSLAATAAKTQAMLKEHFPRTLHDVPPELHPLPPFVSKEQWTLLGNAIRTAENPTVLSIPGKYWISLRCDGNGFGRFIKKLKKHGVFTDQGWSPTMASVMTKCCRELMSKFAAKCGFTQSDEITVLIPPTSVDAKNGQVHHPHAHNGRVQKLCSLAAALVTATFNNEIVRLCHKHGITAYDDNDHDDGLFLACFDCRVGMYETEQEALSVLLWRSYDCGVNGVSDAVFSLKGMVEGAGAMVKESTDHKLKWLYEHSKLPLPPHQREGAYFVKRRRRVVAKDHITNLPVTCLRSRIEQVEGNVLTLFKNNALFPPDEEMDTSEACDDI